MGVWTQSVSDENYDPNCSKRSNQVFTRLVLILGITCSTGIWADDSAKRSSLFGNWQGQEEGGVPTSWSLKQEGEQVRLTEVRGDEKTVDLECNTVGRECALNAAGKPVVVSMWFNGPSLVEMETRSPKVLQRRFTVSEDGNKLEIEVTPISPPGKAETFHFKRNEVTEARK